MKLRKLEAMNKILLERFSSENALGLTSLKQHLLTALKGAWLVNWDL